MAVDYNVPTGNNSNAIDDDLRKRLADPIKLVASYKCIHKKASTGLLMAKRSL